MVEFHSIPLYGEYAKPHPFYCWHLCCFQFETIMKNTLMDIIAHVSAPHNFNIISGSPISLLLLYVFFCCIRPFIVIFRPCYFGWVSDTVYISLWRYLGFYLILSFIRNHLLLFLVSSWGQITLTQSGMEVIKS